MTRPLPARRWLATAALPLALTSFVACGSDEPTTAADSSSPSAGAESPADESATSEDAPALEPGQDVDPAEFMERFQDGFESIETAHVSSELGMGDVRGTMNGEGDVDYTTDPPTVAMTMTNDMSGAMEVRVVDGSLYVNMAQMTKGKFIEIDLADPNNPFGPAFTAQLDPKTALEGLEDGMKSVTFVGAEEVEGETTQHFQMSVDTALMLERMGQELPEGSASGLPDEIGYDVWLDDENRTRRIVVAMGGLGDMSMVLSDYDAEVSIEAPPADEITEAPGSMFGGGA